MANEKVPLESCALFRDLPADVIATIESLGQRRDFAPGELVLRQGEPAAHVFVLLRGSARVIITNEQGDEVTCKLFVGPAVFGEMEALTEGNWIESVQVIHRAQVYCFTRDAFDTVLRDYPAVCRRLLRDVCLRFRTTGLHEAHLAFGTVESRLAALVLSYARVFGVQVEGGTQIVSDEFTQEGLARGLAATRKSVQRAFRRWVDSGLLARRGRYYVVLDQQRLAELAGADAPAIDHTMVE